LLVAFKVQTILENHQLSRCMIRFLVKSGQPLALRRWFEKNCDWRMQVTTDGSIG
jgi:hypothetical protein